MTIVESLLALLVIINSAMLILTIGHVADNKERHTVSTDAGCLDAMSVQYDVIKWIELRKLRLQNDKRKIENELKEVEAVEERAKKVPTILGEVRQGPHAYDPDKPAGHRPKGMDG